MIYKVESESAVNTLGMDIVIYKVVGSDGLTYAESRHQSIASLLAEELTARKFNPSKPSLDPAVV